VSDQERYIRWIVYSVVGAVAAFAFLVSYTHIYDLALHHGQHRPAVQLLPLSVDLLIVAASLVLYLQKRADEHPAGIARWLPRLMLWSGIGATVAANVGYGLPFGWLAAVISAWPGAVFAGLVEMVMVAVRPQQSDDQSGRTAVYRIFGDQDALLYVGISMNPHVRLTEHAHEKPWWGDVQRHEIEWHETWAQAAHSEHDAITAESPRHNAMKSLDGGQRVPVQQPVPQSVLDAARFAYVASFNAANPLSERALCDRFGISRRRAQQIRAEVAQQAARPVAGPPDVAGAVCAPQPAPATHSANGSGPDE
jgi:predicted GIY-YIG superfamily endonuclease